MTDKVIVIGSTDVGRRTCAALEAHGIDVHHLGQPTDAELRERLTDGITGVAVMLHDDIEALRYSLAIEHIKPGVRLFVAIFDRSVRHELEQLIPNCFIASPAFVSIPSIIAAAIKPDTAAIQRTQTRAHPTWEEIFISDYRATAKPFEIPSVWKRRHFLSLLGGQARPYDSGSYALFASLFGLTTIWFIDIVIQLRFVDFAQALYSASAVISGVTAPEHPENESIMIQSAVFMLATIILLAVFGAGIVNHILTGRRVGLIGRRVIPRSQHVVVVGLGQAGLRLCTELKLLSIPVVGIEQNPDSQGIQKARDINVPVILGNASDVRTLKRARVNSAQAICAMSPVEQNNIAVAVAARALDTEATIILRAGSNDAIAETQSLFSIGTVCDINGMTAEYVTQDLIDEVPRAMVQQADQLIAVGQNLSVKKGALPERCACLV